VGGAIFGTLGFMPHEQALGLTDEIDTRTDLWALGAVMYNLVTGEEVHPANGINELVMAGSRRPESVLTVDPKIPPAVARVIDRALQFERADRYPSARAMRDELALAKPSHPGKSVIPVISFAPPPMPVVDVAAANAFAAEGPVSSGFATQMSDDDTLSLRSLFDLIELLLLSQADLEANGGDQRLTPARLGILRKLEEAYEGAQKALETAHIGLFWNVLPEGFATKQGLLWRARPPLAPTPKQMFDGGVRMLGILPGLSIEELSEIARFIRGDLAPFVDYATFLQSVDLPHFVFRIDPTRPGMPEHPSMTIDMTTSSHGNVESMLEALSGSDPPLRAALLKRLERIGEGHEAAMGALLPSVDASLGMGILRVLLALSTDAGKTAIQEAYKSPFPIVRVLAMSMLEVIGDGMRADMKELLEGKDPRARVDALVAVETYKIKAVAPFLAARIKSASFDALPEDEKRQALATMGSLVPARAEALAVGLLQDQRVISAPAHETTRELACEALGLFGTTRAAKDALAAAARGQWRVTERVKAAAQLAVQAFDGRTNALP
jgi:hypothetical protein